MVHSYFNTSELNTYAPFWVQGPNVRGTWDILCSCCFTLSLCVFTAIHLNVGPSGERAYEWWLRKSKWVAIAIVSPEVVLYTAGKQWFSAQRLCKKLGRLSARAYTRVPTRKVRRFWSKAERATQAAPLINPQPDSFSLLYGFFVVMGGFVIDVSHLHNNLSRLTISPKGVAFLAKHGHALKISDSTIGDKSKADILAKTLVCVQVGWTLVQTIARKIVGYPITLLEVHTLVHVACAIGIYGLWFQKPLDLRDPAWVDASQFEDLLALMLVRNYGFGGRVTLPGQEDPIPVKAVQHVYANGSESAYLHMYSKPTETHPAMEQVTSPEKQNSPSDPTMQGCDPSLLSSDTPAVVVHHPIRGSVYSLEPSLQGPAVCTVTSGEALPCGLGPAMTVQSIWSKPDVQRREGHLSICLTRKDIRRWNLAAQALKRTGEELYYDKSKSSVNYFTHYNHSIFLDRKGLQAGFYAYFRAWASGGLIAALTVCMFYGAAHTTAWKFVFPTDVERLLWRIACVDTIGGVISLLAIFSIVVFLHEHDTKMLLRAFFAREKGVMPLLYRVLVVVGIVNVPFFILSRLYIIVETFISLRHVQWGVYATVNWTDYIPHL